MSLPTNQVQQYLQEFYDGGADGEGRARVSDVALLGSGFEADIYAFSAEEDRRGEPQALVLRLYYSQERASEKAAVEFAAMGRLREAGYPVPRAVAFQDEHTPLGRPWVIMERVLGVSLGETYWSAPDERRRKHHPLLCRLMVDLHALAGAGILPDSPLAGSRDPYRSIDQQLHTLSILMDRIVAQVPPSLRDALAWLQLRRDQVPCVRLSVVHGDFHPNNVLVRPDGTAAVIDWSNVRLGDFRWDLAWARLLTIADGLPDSGKAELELYEELAGSKVSNIEYFDVLACVWLLLGVLDTLYAGAGRLDPQSGAAAHQRQNSDFFTYVANVLAKRLGAPMPDLEKALSALFD